MGRLPIDCCTEPTIFFGSCHHVQEGNGYIWLGVLTGELNVRVFGVKMCSKNSCLWAALMTTKVSSTNLFHIKGGCGDVLMALTSKFSMYKFATIGLMGGPMAVPSTCSYLFWKVKYVLLKQNSRRQMMFLTVIDVLCWSPGSSSRSFSMMLRAGWMGTEVKSAFTSYDMMVSSGPSWMPLRCCRNSWLFWTWWGDFATRGFKILDSSFDDS